MTTRVCIADGARVFRAGVREVLQREREFSVSETANLAGLEEQLARGIEILLLDADLPPDGAEAAIAAAAGRCQEIIVWSLRPKPDDVLSAVRAGATGYLRKEISAAGLVRSLRCAARGESPLSRDLTALMIHAIHNTESHARARELTSVLSSRERQVLDHVARGAKNKQIAAALTISEFTVKRHVQNILQKLGVPSRRAAAAFYGSTPDPVGVAGSREAV